MNYLIYAASVQAVRLNPNVGAGPGGAKFQSLLNWTGGICLMAVLGALVIAAAMWAYGHFGNSSHYSGQGIAGVLKAGAAAFVIGFGAQAVNFFYGAGAG